MKTLHQKLCRDLIHSKGMLFAVIAIITIGVGCFVGMLATYQNLEDAKEDFYRECKMADFWVDLKKAPLVDTEKLRLIEGISEIHERIVFPVIVDFENINQPISGQAVSVPDSQQSIVNNIIIQSGSYFSPGEREEVIVSKKFAEARHLLPGMKINILLNGQKKKLTIIGTAISAEHVYLTPPGGIVSDPANYGLFYLKQSFAEDIFGFSGACNSIVGTLTPEGKKRQEIIFYKINTLLESFGIFAVTPLNNQFSNLSLHSEMGGLKTMSTMLPILFLSVAALVLNVLMTRLAEQQRTIIGTLKALGYSNREILFHFLQFGLIVGIIGGIVGCALGYWISGAMNGMYKTFFEFPKLLNSLYPGILSTALFIAVFFAALGTIRGVLSVVRLNPAEAMRESPPETCGRTLFERFTHFWASLTLWWQMILRGFSRNKIRTIIGIFAAMMGSALVLMSLGLSNSMSYMVDFQFDKVMLSNFDIGLKDSVNRDAAGEILRLPGVHRVEPIFSVPCTFSNANHHKKGAITGLVPGAKLTIPRTLNGDPVATPLSGLLMTRRLADELGLKQGSYVQFIPIRGIKKRYSVPIVSIIDSMIGLGVYANYDYLAKLLGEGELASQLQISSHQTPSEEAAFYKHLKTLPKVESVSSILEQKQTINEQMTSSMSAVAFIMILFAGVIFFGSILNASLISISERQREIATYRVLGYQANEIGGLFLRENMLINMIGAVIGLPIGKWMLIGMATQYSNDAFSMPAVVAFSSWIWTVLLAFLFVLGAHYFVQKNINKLNWLEAINYKE